MLRSVLTGDIESSTRMSEDELKHILKVVRDEVVELEEQQILSETEFYRGDSFQVLVKRPEEALRAALIVKTAVNKMITDKSLGKRSKKMYDVAISIGLGEVSGKSGADTQNGRPYILSGRGLDLLKEKHLTLGLFSGDEENDITYRTIFELYHWIIKHWSVSSAELVYHKLQNKTEQQIAPLLGISQSAVNQRSRAACWNGLEQLLCHYREIMDTGVPNETNYVLTPFAYSDLNKLAFWNATGSGKTLLMHVNILQFEHWRKKHKLPDMPNILLVTPNEGLSKQHLEDFRQSDLPANLFSSKGGGLFSTKEINIIEISKLADETGDKTVSHRQFETQNLVLIDEGHRGVAGEAWKRRRDYLSNDGFAFEYSATFGQSVAATSVTKTKESLLNEYSKTILFDYSYRYFYRDGYGKDYHILNVPDADSFSKVRI